MLPFVLQTNHKHRIAAVLLFLLCMPNAMILGQGKNILTFMGGISMPSGDFGVVAGAGDNFPPQFLDYRPAAFAKTGFTVSVSQHWHWGDDPSFGLAGFLLYTVNPLDKDAFTQTLRGFDRDALRLEIVEGGGSYKTFSFLMGPAVGIGNKKSVWFELMTVAGYAGFVQPSYKMQYVSATTQRTIEYESQYSSGWRITLGAFLHIPVWKETMISPGVFYNMTFVTAIGSLSPGSGKIAYADKIKVTTIDFVLSISGMIKLI
jgi:hypothetical protein